MIKLETAGYWFFIIIGVLPIGFGLLYAGGYSVGLVGLLSQGFTLQHWQGLFETKELLGSFVVSFQVALVTVICAASVAAFLALRLRGSLTSGSLAYALYLPLALPATVAAFFVFQLFSDAGMVARLAHWFGFIETPGQFPAMIHDWFSTGVILAHMLFAIPYFTLLFHQIYKQEQLEACCHLTQTLGGTAKDCLFKVVLPVFFHKGLTNLVLLFILVFGAYEIPLLLGKQSPQMISVLTMRKYALFDLAQKPQAFIAALLYTFLVLALLGWVFGRIRRGYHV